MQNQISQFENSEADPESQFWTCTQRPGQVKDDELTGLFDKLAPISPDAMLSSRWKAFVFHTGHPAEKVLMDEMKVAGKEIIQDDEVHLMVYDAHGEWVRSDTWGKSRLCTAEFRGVISATLQYDDQPLADYYRSVSDDTVMVAFAGDESLIGGTGVVYGYMKRIERE